MRCPSLGAADTPCLSRHRLIHCRNGYIRMLRPEGHGWPHFKDVAQWTVDADQYAPFAQAVGDAPGLQRGGLPCGAITHDIDAGHEARSAHVADHRMAS